ncbi:energy transducer TonB [Granulicella mallensis]|uniref:TonB family protein n=1 Tax=Granulicella mallensis (strain ATCC BAA-1857 / DSM 23137 / MP5ACTX8) TaxID=682795 RepID=G8NVV7_GRAMM|nr:TonB family protein [Granulicella mallensis]AEU38860.1 TonB family protein [Granulicella mallensis MP5ACTX8]
MSATRILFVLLGLTVGMAAQQPVLQPSTPPVAAEHDPVIDAAALEIGRALFLRCFCADNNLSFDIEGRAQGSAKTTDWTLSGINVQKVVRKGPGAIELEGVRVAIRYATDRHEFDRHPQNDERMRLTLADKGDATAFERELQMVFSIGIDRPLQRSMPEHWQHYFDPSMTWPQDLLTGAQIVTFAAVPSAGSSQAVVTHRAEAGYTLPASHDHVTGTVHMRLVVDTEGVARHIAIVQPLGYGLDARAVEAAAKYRFTPAMLDGKPVASNVLMNQDFLVVQMPQ